uniref:Uncharacterized protein n=1 Tax=Rhizophora mucronata TaxID=61149 RepID=A0A2P2Q9H0_RHIMU
MHGKCLLDFNTGRFWLVQAEHC